MIRRPPSLNLQRYFTTKTVFCPTLVLTGPAQQVGGCGECPPNTPSSRRQCGTLAQSAPP